MRLYRQIFLFAVAVHAAGISSTTVAQQAGACASREFTGYETTVLHAYIAYYGRPADPGGLTYWANRLKEEGRGLDAIILAFGESEEFDSRFGGFDTRDLVTNIYRQLFGRDPDAGGLDWYSAELDSGRRSLQSIALDVLYGAANDDAQTVSNREVLAQYYVDSVERGVVGDELSAELLSATMAGVGAPVSTLVSACGALLQTVPVNIAPLADAGVDESVDEGAAFSLHGGGSDSDGSIVSFLWTQLDGPPVMLANADRADPYFDAPAVNGDRTLVFQLTITDDDGATGSDQVAILVRDNDLDDFSFARRLNPLLQDIYAYVPDSPYSRVLTTCAAVENGSDSCLLRELPLLGMELENPGIDDIMGRVVVSHEWMGQRFREALEVLPDDMLQLLKGVTAIVIDDEVRPSYYWAGTGAIYLDPAFLWLTAEESETVSDEEDYRTDFGNKLSYRSLWRYVLNNDYASEYRELGDSEDYLIEDVVYDLASLLFHELAHANDYFPPSTLDHLSLERSVFQIAITLSGERVSDHLYARNPLTSSNLFGLAGVNYLGYEPYRYEKRFTATEVGQMFENDFANDDYNYVSTSEDVAMLFEEAMMKFHYGIDRDVAFAPRPGPEVETSCSSYIVKWGRRNRIGHNDVKFRAQLVTDRLLPGRDLSLFFQDLPNPTEMRIDGDWCEALDQSPGLIGAMSIGRPARDLDARVHLDERTPHFRNSPR